MGDEQHLDGGAAPTATPPAEPVAATLPPGPGSDPALLATAPSTGGPADDLVGRRLHHFQVLSLLGQGGMGRVYRAHDLSLDRAVALKVIGHEAQSPQERERFFREARAQARLTHPNVVQIYYIGEQEGLVFFAMELVEGKTLDEPLSRGERLDPDAAVEHLLSVASALELAQERGFIHRDIKPSNLLVGGRGEVKVSDFGLAKPVADDVGLTQKGAIMGSPLYMSPEQGQGETTDHRSDIYALGATFYHLLVGAPPFAAKTPIGVITKHITEPLPSLRCAAPHVPPALAAIVERMLEKDPAKRFQTYAELRRALEAARPRATAPAGIWVRGAAVLVDCMVVLPLLVVVLPLSQYLVLPAIGLYAVLGWWRFGQTVGKWVLRLQVQTLEGGLPCPRAAILRFVGLAWGLIILTLLSALADLFGIDGSSVGWRLAYMLVGLLYLAGLGWTGLRRDRRAIHDRLSGTRVMYHLPPAQAPGSR